MSSELSQVKVRSIVQENTDITVKHVRLLGKGFDFTSYLVNGEWVFRFPHEWSIADTLIRERDLLTRLSLPTRTPRFEQWKDRPVGYPMPIAGYKLICGTSLERLDSRTLDVRVITGKATLLFAHKASLHSKGLRN